MAAVIVADLALMLCIPALSPPMVTSISGLAMTLVLWMTEADNPKRSVRYGGFAIIAAVVAIAIDHSVSGTNEPEDPSEAYEALFWGCAVIFPAIAGVASQELKYRAARLYVIVACGMQSVINVALVYILMGVPSRPAVIPVLIINALFAMYLTQRSLSVNALHLHMPVVFAVYSLGVWVCSPAIQAMTIHGGVVSTLASLVCVLASVGVLCESY